MSKSDEVREEIEDLVDQIDDIQDDLADMRVHSVLLVAVNDKGLPWVAGQTLKVKVKGKLPDGYPDSASLQAVAAIVEDAHTGLQRMLGNG